MNNKIKGIGGALAVVAVIILKLNFLLGKLGTVLKLGVLLAVLMHLTPAKDSTALATRPKMTKPQRQVAQGTTPKSNPADKLAGPVAPAPSSGAALLPSAPLGAQSIQAARNAAGAQNAQLAKETGQEVTPVKGAQPAPAPSQPAAANTQVVQQGTPKPAAHAAANTNVDAPVMRETFDYTRDTRRDPFVSLMTTSDLRPTLTDLRLTGILYDLSGRRPVAILRDIAGGQWRVTTGMTLGRMRVAQIKPKTIIFTIEEFGFNRQDSLILGDTTRVRHR